MPLDIRMTDGTPYLKGDAKVTIVVPYGEKFTVDGGPKYAINRTEGEQTMSAHEGSNAQAGWEDAEKRRKEQEATTKVAYVQQPRLNTNVTTTAEDPIVRVGRALRAALDARELAKNVPALQAEYEQLIGITKRTRKAKAK